MPRNPKKTTKKPKSKKPTGKRRPNRVTNQNTVRVHVVNSLGGDAPAPPPYAGPDRGYFAFNPVFDLGGPKQAVAPPMNTGVGVATGLVKRDAELGPVPGDGIYDGFIARAHESLAIGSGVEFVEMGVGTDPLIEEMTISAIKEELRSRGITGRYPKKKAGLVRLLQSARGY